MPNQRENPPPGPALPLATCLPAIVTPMRLPAPNPLPRTRTPCPRPASNGAISEYTGGGGVGGGGGPGGGGPGGGGGGGGPWAAAAGTRPTPIAASAPS